MARCLLELDNQEEALKLVAPVWDYLQQQEVPGWNSLACLSVMR
jgi:hypothetical protein